MNENNTFYCSFVSIHYIICECGETFPSEEALKEHIEKDPSHTNKLSQAKLEYEGEEIIKEYKCGECEEIYDTEEECIEHQEISHASPVVNEEVVETESSIPQVPYNKPVTNTKPFTVTSKPLTVSSKPLTVSSKPFRVTSQPVNSQLFKLSQPVKIPVVNPDGTAYKPNIITKNALAKESDSNSSDPVVFSQPVTITTKPLTVNVRRRAVKLKTAGKEKKPKIQYSNVKKVVCEVCGKNYASNAALSYHQRVHTGVRPYQCTYCPKNFTMPLFLQIHLRIHTGEKPYQCPHCPKAFTNKAALLRHDRVHTGEKPYECPKCGKSFSQSNSMKLHVLTVHLKLPAPYKSKKRRAESLAREARDRGIRVFDLLDSMDQVQVKSEVDYPNTNEDGEVYHEGYEEVYPKDEEVYPNNSEDVYPDSEQVYPSGEQVYHTENGEVYYYDIPQKEEIAYEIIYEQ